VGLTSGLVFGLAVGLVAALDVGLVVGLVKGLIVGLVVGLVVGLLGGTYHAAVSSKPVDVLRWSWPLKRSGLVFLMVGGLAAGLIFKSLVAALVNALAVGLVAGLFGGLGGFVAGEVNTRAIPNDGTRRSGRNALFVLLFAWLGGGLIGAMIGGLVAAMIRGPIGALVFKGQVHGQVCGLVLGLVFALDKGVWFFLQHWGMRLVLWRSDYAPFRYVRFLDYAADRIFLRKVGGGYVFIHRMLMEYFASLAEENHDRQRSSPNRRGNSGPNTKFSN
jgi:hypothetical protein